MIGLGTWQTFDVGRSQDARAPLAEVLAAFAELGGKLVDSSPMYGNSEEVVGDLAAQIGLQEKLFIATKVWTSGRQEGITQMEDSIRKLRADPIDLMQAHNLVDVNTHLATLREWKLAGRVRYIGVTHYTAGGHDAVARIVETQPLDFIQVNYSVGEREAERRRCRLPRSAVWPSLRTGHSQEAVCSAGCAAGHCLRGRRKSAATAGRRFSSNPSCHTRRSPSRFPRPPS